MSGFHDLVENGCRRVGDSLTTRVSAADIGEIIQSVRRLHILGFLTFLASGQRPDEATALSPQLFLLSEEGITKALTEIGKRRGVPLTSDQMKEAADLLLSGQVYDDVASGVAVMLHAVPRLPFNVAGDITHVPQLIPALVVGISQDLRDSPSLILEMVGDLKDGELDGRHKVMVHTLRAFFQLATAESLINLLRTLIGPEYETFRLAVLVYAASKGIRIDEEDLDRLRVALDPQNPDLGPLLESAFKQLLSRYPGARMAQHVLHNLGAHPASHG